MGKNHSWAVASDVEGPLKNGQYDGAKHLMTTLVERKLMSQAELDIAAGAFDEHDDDRDREYRFAWSPSRHKSLTVRPRWSTGTLPGLAICYAARAGLQQEEVYEMTKAGDVPTPGANGFLRRTIEKGIPVYLLTSAEPSVALRLGKEMRIPSSRIFSMGYRPSLKKLAQLDANPDPEAEAEERSVLRELLPYRRKLDAWLPPFVKTGADWKAAFDAGDKRGMAGLELEQYNMLTDPTCPQPVIDLFLHQSVLMGAHQKGEVVHGVARRGRRVIYTGDSIVDYGASLAANAWGGYGVAVNSTSDDLNYAAGLLLATHDMQAMDDITNAIVPGNITNTIAPGKVDVPVINGKIVRYGAMLYTPVDMRNNPAGVLAHMKSCKTRVKGMYRATS